MHDTDFHEYIDALTYCLAKVLWTVPDEELHIVNVCVPDLSDISH